MLGLLERVEREIRKEKSLFERVKKLAPHEQEQMQKYINHLLGETK
jgi:hypothetical protein